MAAPSQPCGTVECVGIPDEEIAQVRAATDIVALISEHSLLKKVGRRWTGLCPFHTEKTPSFSVNAEEGFYYCFGCQQSGDAITFVRATDHLDFVDAVRFLADRAGVTLHEDAESGRDHQRRSQLLDAMERAVQWYHERLLERARRRPCARLPAFARLRRRRRAPLPPGVGSRRLGRDGQGAATA